MLVSISQVGRMPPSIAKEPRRPTSGTIGTSTSASALKQEDWCERHSSRRCVLAFEDLREHWPMLLFVLSGMMLAGLSGHGGNISEAPVPMSLPPPQPLEKLPAAGLLGRDRGTSWPTPLSFGCLQPLSRPIDPSTPVTALSGSDIVGAKSSVVLVSSMRAGCGDPSTAREHGGVVAASISGAIADHQDGVGVASECISLRGAAVSRSGAGAGDHRPL